MSVESGAGDPTLHEPDDAFLVASLLGGDEVALRKLMGRYDRLVRYTVFRRARNHCLRDPQWLDAAASAVWAGFVQSMRRDPDHAPRNVSAYLIRITRNRVVSMLRTAGSKAEVAGLDAFDDVAQSGADHNPAELLARIEHLDALRACLAALPEDDRTLVGLLPAITERRWRDAAEALSIKESTLRSRWKRVLERLRACLAQKNADGVAPRGSPSD